MDPPRPDDPQSTCTRCGLACDDLVIAAHGGAVQAVEHACDLGRNWLLEPRESGPAAVVQGQPVSLTEAVKAAAALLTASRLPLLTGFANSTVACARAAIALAERCRGVIDPGPSHALRALQQAGMPTCSLGEIRQRADVLIALHCDPHSTHPRLFQRLVDPPGRFVPAGRTGRFLIHLGGHTQPSWADWHLSLDEASTLPALWSLRLALAGRISHDPSHAGLKVGHSGLEVGRAGLKVGHAGHDPGRASHDPSHAGHDAGRASHDAGRGGEDVSFASHHGGRTSHDVWQPIAARLKQARYVVWLFDERLDAACCAELFRLTADLHAWTRAAAVCLHADTSPLADVLCWQTGFAAAVSFASQAPEPGPTAEEILARGGCDLALLAGPVPPLGPAAQRRLDTLPLIRLSHHPADLAQPCQVGIRVGEPGYDVPGVVRRLDGVMLPARAVTLPSRPALGEVLQAVLAELS